MSFKRRYYPGDEDVIYHYCSAEVFNLICSNKKLRFCDLFTMNDSKEMHWGYSKWEEAVTSVYEQVDHELINEMDMVIHSSGLSGLALATCFSRNKDLLSQWRAYADDGKGYVVGFKASSLLNLPVMPLEILYEESKQRDEIAKTILAINEVEQNEIPQRSNDFFNACFEFSFNLAAYKNPCFYEEDEVRLMHLLNFVESNKSLKLVDIGGYRDGIEVPGEKVQFFMKESVPVAYIDLDFFEVNSVNPIVEVIIGPRNSASVSAISIYLETMNLGNVGVIKSTIPYR